MILLLRISYVCTGTVFIYHHLELCGLAHITVSDHMKYQNVMFSTSGRHISHGVKERESVEKQIYEKQDHADLTAVN